MEIISNNTTHRSRHLLEGILLGMLFLIPGYMYHLQEMHELKMQVVDDIQWERERISKPYSQLIDKLAENSGNRDIIYSEMAAWELSGQSVLDKYLN